MKQNTEWPHSHTPPRRDYRAAKEVAKSVFVLLLGAVALVLWLIICGPN